MTSRVELQHQSTRVQILALPPSSCVTPGKLLNFSFSHLQNGDDYSNSLGGFCENLVRTSMC